MPLFDAQRPALYIAPGQLITRRLYPTTTPEEAIRPLTPSTDAALNVIFITQHTGPIGWHTLSST